MRRRTHLRAVYGQHKNSATRRFTIESVSPKTKVRNAAKFAGLLQTHPGVGARRMCVIRRAVRTEDSRGVFAPLVRTRSAPGLTTIRRSPCLLPSAKSKTKPVQPSWDRILHLTPSPRHADDVRRDNETHTTRVRSTERGNNASYRSGLSDHVDVHNDESQSSDRFGRVEHSPHFSKTALVRPRTPGLLANHYWSTSMYSGSESADCADSSASLTASGDGPYSPMLNRRNRGSCRSKS